MKQCVIHWPINNRTIMMQERCAAADTVSLVARMLHRSRTRLQSMLLQNTAIEDFYVNLVLLPLCFGMFITRHEHFKSQTKHGPSHLLLIDKIIRFLLNPFTSL